MKKYTANQQCAWSVKPCSQRSPLQPRALVQSHFPGATQFPPFWHGWSHTAALYWKSCNYFFATTILYSTHVLLTYLHYRLLQSIQCDSCKCPVLHILHLRKKGNMHLYSVEHITVTHDTVMINSSLIYIARSSLLSNQLHSCSDRAYHSPHFDRVGHRLL